MCRYRALFPFDLDRDHSLTDTQASLPTFCVHSVPLWLSSHLSKTLTIRIHLISNTYVKYYFRCRHLNTGLPPSVMPQKRAFRPCFIAHLMKKSPHPPFSSTIGKSILLLFICNHHLCIVRLTSLYPHVLFLRTPLLFRQCCSFPAHFIHPLAQRDELKLKYRVVTQVPQECIIAI